VAVGDSSTPQPMGSVGQNSLLIRKGSSGRNFRKGKTNILLFLLSKAPFDLLKVNITYYNPHSHFRDLATISCSQFLETDLHIKGFALHCRSEGVVVPLFLII